MIFVSGHKIPLYIYCSDSRGHSLEIFSPSLSLMAVFLLFFPSSTVHKPFPVHWRHSLYANHWAIYQIFCAISGTPFCGTVKKIKKKKKKKKKRKKLNYNRYQTYRIQNEQFFQVCLKLKLVTLNNPEFPNVYHPIQNVVQTEKKNFFLNILIKKKKFTCIKLHRNSWSLKKKKI